ncbi:hypothetical protein Tco_0836536 [Tanacetum coccineum]
MNQNYFEPNYSGFDQPLQYSINHQEDLHQQGISDVHDRWDKLEESQNELLNTIQSFCEKFLQQKQAASIDQSPFLDMSIQDMENLKQHYLDEIMGDEHLSTILEKESDEFIMYSVEDLVPIPRDLDFVSLREMITSQLQGKLWLYDEVRTRLCLFCHHQIGEDCWDY